MTEALGLAEIRTFSGALVVADIMAKAAGVRLLNVEINDFYGAMVRVAGDTAAVTEAIEQCRLAADAMRITIAAEVYPRPLAETMPMVLSPAVRNWLLGVIDPIYPEETATVSNESKGQALGFIETQGVTACYEACDTMLKTADVEYVGLEKIGGGYVTVIVRGDVGAVTTAVEAGAAACQRIGGNFIASHVIARPHPELAGMMPKK